MKSDVDSLTMGDYYSGVYKENIEILNKIHVVRMQMYIDYAAPRIAVFSEYILGGKNVQRKQRGIACSFL